MHTHDSSAINGPSIILLCGEVSEDLVEAFTGQLLMLDEKPRPGGITVRISSHGGCAGAGFAIHDAIRHARNKVTTECWGMAESAAALIFQAGHLRLMAPSSRLLLHDVQSESSTTTGSRGIEAHARDIAAMEALYNSLIAGRAGIEPQRVAGWCRDITAFSANEAVKVGLADGVLGELPKFKEARHARARR